MTLQELYDDLGRILKVHPEAGTATIWSRGSYTNHETYVTRMGYVVYDTKHKPPRIVFEEGL